MGFPDQRPCEVGRTRPPVGPALHRTVRPQGRRAVRLEGLERAGHWLLARHAGGVFQALRLCRGGRETRLAGRAGGRPRDDESRQSQSRRISDELPDSLPARQELPHWKTGAPLDFISLHARGGVRLTEGHAQMDIHRHLTNTAKGFERRFPASRVLRPRGPFGLATSACEGGRKLAGMPAEPGRVGGELKDQRRSWGLPVPHRC